MKSLIGSFIGLVLSVSVGAEPLLEGRVSLSSGQPAAGVQVRLFDLTDLRRFVGTTTDETGYFALSLQTFSTNKSTALPTDFALGQNYPKPFNPSTMEADDSVCGLTVSGEGLVAYVNPAFRVGVDEVGIVVEEHGGARMKKAAGGVLGDVDGNGQVDIADALFVAMYSLDSSIMLPDNGDISRGDVNGDGMVDVADAVLLLRYLSNPSDPALPSDIGLHVVDPLDLVVAASVNDSTLAFGQSFWLRATVRNQGGGEPEPTVLFYYSSTDATITSDDTQIGADVVSLETSNVATKSLSLAAPEEAGTYYYGACVQSVSGEHNTDNNCSDAVRVTVSSDFAYTPSTITPEVGLYGTLVSTFTNIFFAALIPGTTVVPGEGGGSVEILGNDWTFQNYSPDGALIINGTLKVGLDQTPIPLTGNVTFSGSYEAEIEVDMQISVDADGLYATGTITIDGAEFDVAELSAAATAAVEAAG